MSKIISGGRSSNPGPDNIFGARGDKPMNLESLRRCKDTDLADRPQHAGIYDTVEFREEIDIVDKRKSSKIESCKDSKSN